MLQRIQSVYLLLSVICLAVFIFLPAGIADQENFIPKDDMLSMILACFAALLALVSIFMFINRRVQIRFCGRTLALLIALLLVTFYSISKADFNIGYGVALLPLSGIFVSMAINSIKKDDKLVRDMDRLR